MNVVFALLNPIQSGIGSIVGFLFPIAMIAGAVWFFRGPAHSANKYVTDLEARFSNPGDAALFRRIYVSKGPKSTLVAWLLTMFLSPTISYIYQGKWGLAVIAFITFQGLFLWWILSIFIMPLEVMSRNKKLADQAYNEVLLARGSSATAFAS